MTAPIGQHWQQVNECEDLLGAKYRARTYSFRSYQGTVDTTLVDHLGEQKATRGILYIHGYTDYFFQTGLAEHFIALGYRFYAIDLQGYGRSIRPNFLPNWCDSIDQYWQDLDIALATMKQDGINQVTLLAHSTGGLIASGYVAQPYSPLEREQYYQRAFPDITGLILNSPFLAMPFSPKVLDRLSGVMKMIVSVCSSVAIQAKKPSLYAQSLHTKFGGDWDYRLDWKPLTGFPLSFYWLKQIMLAQQQLSHQCIDTPTLLCHSEISTIHKKTISEMQCGDGVLDIHSMQNAAEKCFNQLSKVAIEQGFHDLYLSRLPARQKYLAIIDNWLSQQPS